MYYFTNLAYTKSRGKIIVDAKCVRPSSKNTVVLTDLFKMVREALIICIFQKVVISVVNLYI